MTNREILTAAGYEEVIVLENPDFDNAIIGVTEDRRVIYSFEKMMEHLMEEHDMSQTDAEEFIFYNTIRALPYAGEGAPIVMEQSIEELKELI